MRLAFLTNNRSRRARASRAISSRSAGGCRRRGHQVTVLARGGAFAPWAESDGGWPAGPPLPVLPRAALPSCAGAQRAGRLAARWGRRRRAAARSPATAAAVADRPAGGRDVSQPDAARHRCDRRAGTAPGADQGQRASVQPPLRAGLSRPRHGGGRGVERGPQRARDLLSAAGPATEGDPERCRYPILRPGPAVGSRVGRALCRPARATGRVCSGCSTPSPGCHDGPGSSSLWPARGRWRLRCIDMPPHSGITARVRFAGFLDRAGVRDELRQAACFVNPADYETGPLTLLEAMACGTPVVSTATGLAAEMGAVAAAAAVRTGAGGHGGGDRGHARRSEEPLRPTEPARRAHWSRAGIAGNGSSISSKPSTDCGRSVRHDPAAAGTTSRAAVRGRVPAASRPSGAGGSPGTWPTGSRAGCGASGHDVWLLTDLAGPMSPTPYAVEALSALLAHGQASGELRAALSRVPVDQVFMLTGAAQLARLRRLELGAPVSLVMASPRLRLRRAAAAGRARACARAGAAGAAPAQRDPARCVAARRPAPFGRDRDGLSEPGRAGAISRARVCRPVDCSGRRSTRRRCCRRPTGRAIPRRLFRPATGDPRRRSGARCVRAGSRPWARRAAGNAAAP